MANPTLILASASLSRRELLSHAGLAFEVEPSGVDEAEATRSLMAERASPQDIVPWEEAPLLGESTYRAEARSVVVLFARRAATP